jgi:DNA invertase Pin-like site-specific DNA recombinase
LWQPGPWTASGALCRTCWAHSVNCTPRASAYLHQQGLDTSTPAGKAMFQMMGVFAEFERAMIRERVMAGLKRAKANGTTLGRPKIDEAAKTAARKALRSGKGIIKVAKELGLGVGTVHRIKLEMSEAA